MWDQTKEYQQNYSYSTVYFIRHFCVWMESKIYSVHKRIKADTARRGDLVQLQVVSS